MKKHVLYFVVLVIISGSVYTQAVGYQGKKFMIELGYSPISNLAAKYSQYSLADDYYGVYDSVNYTTKDPLLFKHIIKLNIEYVVFNRGSLVLRYNPFNITSNLQYYDVNTNAFDFVGVRSSGSMFSFGYKSYSTSSPAPLGGYFGIYATIFSFNTEFTESEFAETPMPEDFGKYQFEKESIPGLSISYGVKNIFWDKVTLDISLEAGYFFKDLTEYSSIDDNIYSEQYNFSSTNSPIYNTVVNTRAFFFAVPTISFGYLAF